VGALPLGWQIIEIDSLHIGNAVRADVNTSDVFERSYLNLESQIFSYLDSVLVFDEGKYSSRHLRGLLRELLPQLLF